MKSGTSTLTLMAAWAVVAACASSASAEPTPETRALTAEEAAQALERDWLFQAMGEPLLERAAREIGWARELAERLACHGQAPDLSAELKKLEVLERRLAELRSKPVPAKPAEGDEATPSWIWYPEGQPAADAPAESRFFRCRFKVPVKALAARLRVAADDACEVFVNGTRVGAPSGWPRAAVFDVGELLAPGENVLAVRAQNMPAPSKNPAGLIARLVVTLPDGKEITVVSDATWLVEKETHPQWEQPTFDDSAWKSAAIAAPFGGGPWGKIAGLVGPDLQEDPIAAYIGADPEFKEAYFAVRRVKRAILLKNPVLDFSQLLFI